MSADFHIQTQANKIENKADALSLAIIACQICFLLFINFSISLSQISAFLGIGLWFTKLTITRSWAETRWPLRWPFALFAVITIAVNIVFFDADVFTKELRRLFLIFIFFWVINTFSETHLESFLSRLPKFLKPKPVQGEVSKTTGPRELHGASLYVILFISMGVLSACLGLLEGFSMEEAILWRSSGTLADVVSYSLLLMVAMVMAVSGWIFCENKKAFFTLSIIFLAAGLILSLTRQAWLGVLVASLFLIFLKNRFWAMIFPLLLAIAISLAPQPITDRFYQIVDPDQYDENNAVGNRIRLWKAGWDVFKDHPVMGCGAACLTRVYQEYPQHPILNRLQHLHNSILQIAVDMGILGLSSWLMIWIAYLVKLYRIARHGLDDTDRWIVFGVTGVIIAFFISGLFENNFFDSEFMMLLYFIMALPFVVSRPDTPSTSSSTAS